MHIQVSGQQKQTGESLQSAAESQFAGMAAGCFRGAALRIRRDQGLQIAGRARKRLGRYGRYSARSGDFAKAAGQIVGARAAPAPRKAAHGGLDVVYRRPDGNIDWIDAGPERPARG